MADLTPKGGGGEKLEDDLIEEPEEDEDDEFLDLAVPDEGDGDGGVGRCLVVHPYLKGRHSPAASQGAVRGHQARLDEIVGLAEAINLDICAVEIVALTELRPNAYFGKGTLERLGSIIKAQDLGLAIIDAHLSPVQQRNIETAWECKVLDRTGIILEIFGERARTKEGRLQVELAHMTYQRSRLVRSWTHLERQRGGAGFMGGPGETQIEVDRRLIDQRIDKLKRQLKEVKRTRELHRAARRKVPYPIVALVGYTNAGKSTLFNRLTNADVFVKDQLFATLDPTMRTLELPSGNTIILSDTVGFISDLPHELVEAFHATLEEVLEAQVVVHVRDIAHADTDAQAADVAGVLKDLGLDAQALQGSYVEVRNKADLLSEEEHTNQFNQVKRADSPIVLISAVSGEGIDGLLGVIEGLLSHAHETLDVTLAPADGKMLAWLYAHGDVVSRSDAEDGQITLSVRLEPANKQRFEQMRSS